MINYEIQTDVIHLEKKMKTKTLILLSLLSALILLAACSAPAASADNPQATIDAAVQATTQAQSAQQAAIDAAVKATTQAQSTQQSNVNQAVQATLTAQPTPDYATLSEEELAALIETAVNQALTDYTATSSSVTQTTSDGTVTTDEVSATTTYVNNVYNEVAYADELIQAYYDYYGDYAEEALATMNAMEQDLSVISSSLDEISTIMAQGAEAATAAIDQLNAAAAAAQTKASDLQTKVKGLQDQVKTGLGQREKSVLDLPANNVADNQLGALNQAHDFLDAFKTSLGDGKFSPDELANIGQLGANARASLQKTGDPKLQGFGDMIGGLSSNAARGEWGKARGSMGDFERSLPARRR